MVGGEGVLISHNCYCCSQRKNALKWFEWHSHPVSHLVSVVRPCGIRYRNTSKLVFYHFKNSRYGPMSSEAAVTHSRVWRREKPPQENKKQNNHSQADGDPKIPSFFPAHGGSKKMFAFREHFKTSLVTYFLEGFYMLKSLRFCFWNNASRRHLFSSSITVILVDVIKGQKVKTPEALTSNNVFSISLTPLQLMWM